MFKKQLFRREISYIMLPVIVLYTLLSGTLSSADLPRIGCETIGIGSFSIRDNPYKYSGYYFDSESGMYYCQARYYSPELMRFVNRDTYDLSNRYAYCNGDPISNVDPNGHMSTAVGEWICNDVQIGIGFLIGLIPGIGFAGTLAAGILSGLVCWGMSLAVKKQIDRSWQCGTDDLRNLGVTMGGEILGAFISGAMGLYRGATAFRAIQKMGDVNFMKKNTLKVGMKLDYDSISKLENGVYAYREGLHAGTLVVRNNDIIEGQKTYVFFDRWNKSLKYNTGTDTTDTLDIVTGQVEKRVSEGELLEKYMSHSGRKLSLLAARPLKQTYCVADVGRIDDSLCTEIQEEKPYHFFDRKQNCHGATMFLLEKIGVG